MGMIAEVQTLKNSGLNPSLERARIELQKQIEKSQREDPQSALSELKELVTQARGTGVGYQKIAEIFTASGIKMGKQDVVIFCRDSLGEKSTLRKKKKNFKKLKSSSLEK